MAQAKLVAEAIRRCRPGIEVELVTMKTSGDIILDRSLDAIGGKGLFIKELDEALLSGRVDVCVHSYKDMPVPDNPDLPVVAVGSREDPRDVLILPENNAGGGIAGPIGTSSLRRRSQLAALYPETACEPVRGNVQTRLRKLDSGQYGALVLAAAGLKRLGLWRRADRVFAAEELLPAACQGVIAVQGRKGEPHPYLDGFHCPDAMDACRAERAFIEGLGATCASPVAAYATVADGELSLAGLYVDPGGALRRGERRGRREDAVGIGLGLAEDLLTERRKS